MVLQEALRFFHRWIWFALIKPLLMLVVLLQLVPIGLTPNAKMVLFILKYKCLLEVLVLTVYTLLEKIILEK